MEERCARGLLMRNDRAGQDTFPLTQELISHMLGVRRATVNVMGPSDYSGLMAKAKLVSLEFGQRLYRQDESIDAVYFPLATMVSLLVTSKQKPGWSSQPLGETA